MITLEKIKQIIEKKNFDKKEVKFCLFETSEICKKNYPNFRPSKHLNFRINN